MSTIYTTANILVSSTLAEQGFAPFGILDFIPVGLPMGVAGILFIVLIGRRWLPAHGLGGQTIPQRRTPSLTATYHLVDNIRAVYVMPGSDMSGLSLAEAGWGRKLGLNVVGISRGGKVMLAPSQSEEVIAGDIVLFNGELDDNLARQHRLFFTQDPDWKGQLISDQISLVEVILAPRSSIAGKTLREIHFREKYELTILAIWREGKILQQKLADIPLRFGDTLLLQGAHSRINVIRREVDYLVLDEDIAPIKSPHKTILSVGLTIFAILLPALNILPIAEAAFSAAILMVITNCISIDESYAAIDWKTIFMVAAMLPLGTAIANTGTADFLGRLVIEALGNFSPLAIAGGMFILAALLTQVMPGQATAVILTPIAIAAGLDLRIDPRGMAMTVALGCSMAFLTPFGHATNLLVMAPGGYTVKDYARVGWPLMVLLFFVMLAATRLYWGF
jgi:di/tricarboxylate transporter